MDPFAVIKYPYIFKYCWFRLFPSLEMLAIQPLLLKLPPEALHRRIVPAVPSAAHAADKTMVFCKLLIFLWTVLAFPVGMQDTSGCSLCMAERILKRGYHKIAAAYKGLCRMFFKTGTSRYTGYLHWLRVPLPPVPPVYPTVHVYMPLPWIQYCTSVP